MVTHRPSISETELEVLRVLWDEGSGTVRELRDRLERRRRRWAYTTVQTLLNRLKHKGYVARNESGMAHVFRAAVSRDKLLGWRLRELADQICGGTATPLMLNLVRAKKLTDEELISLRRILDEATRDGSRSEPRKRRAKRRKKANKKPARGIGR